MNNSSGGTISSNDKKRRSRTVHTGSFAMYGEDTRSQAEVLDPEYEDLTGS